ncbi:MAG: cyclase family protein [Faecousia sp.]
MHYQFLSYRLEPDSACCPGAVRAKFTQTRHVTEGWPQNEWNIEVPNHLGTHMDAPNHHYDAGLKIADLPMDRFVYEHPYIVEIEIKEFNELIPRSALEPYAEQIAKCDLLMLRTGFSKYHETEKEIYGGKAPGVSAEAAEYINKCFPNVKGVMMDIISLTSYTQQDDGNKAHKWLLGEWSDHFCTIIEDANLEGLENGKIGRVFCLPVRYACVDSAQVSVLAEILD